MSDHDELIFDNLPNRLTLFRIALIPLIIGPLLLISMKIPWALQREHLLGWISGCIFALAGFTDFVDGYIARTRNLQTVFGSFLDPIADKFLVVSVLIMHLDLERIPTIIVIILVLRELYMTSLRLLANDHDLSVPVSSSGKWKTTFQMLGVGFLMPNESLWFIPLPLIGKIFVYIACILSVYSAIIYSIHLLLRLRAKRKGRR